MGVLDVGVNSKPFDWIGATSKSMEHTESLL